ncbi:GNAT family N-acetyltransferase [Paenibacillus illinoisensis]|uniref:GNAT family N-acetyltransferase n=1 Tax=Paenibacillus illinoisensis TaxID=59845 RepID=UPI0036F3C258
MSQPVRVEFVIYQKAIPIEFQTYLSIEHRAVLKQMPDFFAAVGALIQGKPAGVALIHLPVLDSKRTAKLLDINIDQTHRRQGIGRALMNQLCLLLRKAGVHELTVEYLASEMNQPKLSAFFQACGFDLSVPGIYVYSSSLQVPSEFPWVRSLSLPDSLTTRPFYSISPEEREQIHGGLGEWYPSILDPFAEKELIDKSRSVFLRHNGEIVGWLIFEHFDDKTILCKTMFVRTPFQRMARGIALMAEASRRLSLDPVYSELVFFVEAENQPMVKFIKKHVCSPQLKEEILWRSQQTLH